MRPGCSRAAIRLASGLMNQANTVPDALPSRIGSVAELDALLARPTPVLTEDLARVDGDILILGAGGKMGPTVARLARNAAPGKRVVAVARFSTAGLREQLERDGIETISADLLDRDALSALP